MGGAVALVHQLVGSGDNFDVVGAVELLGDVFSEGEAGASGALSPALNVVWIGPDNVAHGSFVGDLLDSVQFSDAVEGAELRAESSVDAEDLILVKKLLNFFGNGAMKN